MYLKISLEMKSLSKVARKVGRCNFIIVSNIFCPGTALRSLSFSEEGMSYGTSNFEQSSSNWPVAIISIKDGESNLLREFSGQSKFSKIEE